MTKRKNLSKFIQPTLIITSFIVAYFYPLALLLSFALIANQLYGYAQEKESIRILNNKISIEKALYSELTNETLIEFRNNLENLSYLPKNEKELNLEQCIKELKFNPKNHSDKENITKALKAIILVDYFNEHDKNLNVKQVESHIDLFLEDFSSTNAKLLKAKTIHHSYSTENLKRMTAKEFESKIEKNYPVVSPDLADPNLKTDPLAKSK